MQMSTGQRIFLQTVADRLFCYQKGICVQITQGNDAPGIKVHYDGKKIQLSRVQI
jgi:hypothetical protein